MKQIIKSKTDDMVARYNLNRELEVAIYEMGGLSMIEHWGEDVCEAFAADRLKTFYRNGKERSLRLLFSEEVKNFDAVSCLIPQTNHNHQPAKLREPRDKNARKRRRYLHAGRCMRCGRLLWRGFKHCLLCRAYKSYVVRMKRERSRCAYKSKYDDVIVLMGLKYDDHIGEKLKPVTGTHSFTHNSNGF